VNMEALVLIIEILSPALQALAGGLVAIFGAFIVQSRNHKSDRNALLRSKIEDIYVTTLRMEKAVNDEVLAMALIHKNGSLNHPRIHKKLDELEALTELSQTLDGLVMLYLPNLKNHLEDIHQAEGQFYYIRLQFYEEMDDIKQSDFDNYIDPSSQNFSTFCNKFRAELHNEIKLFI